MKKAFFIVLATLLLSIQMVSAQNKGDWYVGGLIGLDGSFHNSDFSLDNSSSSYNSFTLKVAPEIGLFVTNGLRIGVGVDYRLSFHPSSNTSNSSAIYVGPNIAYYFKLCDRIYYTPTLYASYYYSKGSSYTKVSGFDARLELGAFEFKPTEHLGISVSMVSLRYSYTKNEIEDPRQGDYTVKGNSFDFNLAYDLSVGLKYYF